MVGRGGKFNLRFRLVKMMDIGYITLLYFITGLIMALILDIIFEKFDAEEENKKHIGRSLLEVIGIIWMNGIIIYFIRNLVQLVPSPFNGLEGLNHFRVSELKTAAIFTFIFLSYQENLVQKLTFLYNKVLLFSNEKINKIKF